MARTEARPAARPADRPAAHRPGSAPEYAVIGDHLREVRLGRGLSLRALAARVGVSPSLISQVETGRARPSVRTLYAIVSELGISLDELLFPDAARAAEAAASRPRACRPTGAPARARGTPPFDIRLPDEPVQRSGDRKVIRLASGVTWERLTTESIPNVDFLYVTYEVGGASSPEREFQRHPRTGVGLCPRRVARRDDRVRRRGPRAGRRDRLRFDDAAPAVQRRDGAGPRPLVRARPAVRRACAARRRWPGRRRQATVFDTLYSATAHSPAGPQARGGA